jgi:hypothetical protein
LPFDRAGDYTLQLGDRRHDFRTNGTFALPLGPQKLLFGRSSGVLARIVENWQMSWIVNLNSGDPQNISTYTNINNAAVGVNQLYANGVPDIVGPFDPKSVSTWNEIGVLTTTDSEIQKPAISNFQCGLVNPHWKFEIAGF